ncbi:MAG: glycoside hydrolase family 4 [Planctomycetota bacterium]
MEGPKVVVIGAGSLFFGRQALWQMLHSEILRAGTLAYVDIDAERQEKMMGLARLMIDHLDSPLGLEGSTDRRAVLPGADFVVLSFAREGVRYRGIDCEISAKYGVRMCSGDTIGPGGIFRALRELPVVLRVAEDIRELCPGAWVINYINPTAVHGIGLMREAPDLKSFALCDGHHMPGHKKKWLRRTGIAASDDEITDEMMDKLDMRIAGVNHFTWILSARYDGDDLMPRIREHMEDAAAGEADEGHSKARFNNSYGLELWDLFGACPDSMGHTKEYVPYWQGHTVADDRLPPLSIFDAERRQERHDAMWAEVDDYLAGRLEPGKFMDDFGPDHATDIIESMWGGLGKPFFINGPNRGAVPNMDDDAFFELLCDVDLDGFRPLPVGEFPRGLRALQQQVLDTHELTARAAARCDRGLLRRAMATDPIVNSIADGDRIIDELLEAERDALPDEWYE